MAVGLLAMTLFAFVAAPTALASPVCACYYDRVEQFDPPSIINRCTLQPSTDEFDESSKCVAACSDIYGGGLASTAFADDSATNDGAQVEIDCRKADLLAQNIAPVAPILDEKNLDYIKPNLIVPIPNLTFTPILLKDGKLQINYIADYITAMYRWLLGAAVFFAIVFVMIGGLQYVIGSGSADVDAGKTRIRNAIVGLILLMSVTLILYTVNPKLTLLHSVRLQFIDPVKFIQESGDTEGTVATQTLSQVGILCDPGKSLADNAQQFVGRATYRFGGKGGVPPYEAETKTDHAGRAYSEYCPDNTVCVDCSGFVAVLAKCAGLPSRCPTCGTANIFASAPKIGACTKDSVILEGGTQYTLKDGDLVGFKPGDYPKVQGFGHVWMYIGNGRLVNSAASGRIPGQGVKFGTLTEVCKNYPLRLIER